MSTSAFAPTLGSPLSIRHHKETSMTRFRFFTVMIGLWLSCTSLSRPKSSPC